MRPVTLFWMVFVLVAALAVYEVKYDVREIKQDVASLEAQLAEENEAIHVLEAEWAYLTRPERLMELSAKHLPLGPVVPTQIRDEQSLSLLEDAFAESSLAAAEGEAEHD